ncbi:MAG TPA: hypothetical protein VM870_03620 [Pyrinomonadaceae bacterium]|jgi:hypothetical protein|nr:hypothetical protein [Pyrinomonadaceae bacterium]
MNKHRPRKLFRIEYIPGKYGGLTEEERQWRVWEDMDKEDIGYDELVERLEAAKTEKENKENPTIHRDADSH